LLKKLVKYLRFIIWKLKLKIRGSFGSKYFDPSKIYWINPQKIEYCSLKGYGKWHHRGKIIGGDWDQQKIRIVDLDVYKAFRDRFLYGKNWEDTEFYHRVLNEIYNGKVKWECKNKEEFDERCKYLDSLFRDIKNNGYKSQKEISKRVDNPYKPYDEIAVSVNHDGKFLLEDGRHRLIIAKLLNIDKVPVQVIVRHSKWHKFKREVISYAEKNSGKVYHPITHPDLCNIPAVHGEKRFEIIKQNLSFKRGNLLDIGAHWGYFCHKFEEEGFTCYAIENDPTHLYFLKKLKKAESRNFKIINKSILEYQGKMDFDVVLALNVFHHFLKEKKEYYQLIEFLKRLITKVMFFEPHLPNEPQMKKAYVNYNCEEFVNFILEHSPYLNRAVHIGEAEDGRPIYKLYN